MIKKRWSGDCKQFKFKAATLQGLKKTKRFQTIIIIQKNFQHYMITSNAINTNT